MKQIIGNRNTRIPAQESNEKRTTGFALTGNRAVSCLAFSLFILYHVPMGAQQQETHVTLDEVEVKAARIIPQTDGWTLYPVDEVKKTSHSGYAVLQKLNLPNIRIDDTGYQISTIDNRGKVQIRINGIPAGKPELLSLNPADIRKIEFIDQPGVRYGDDVAYVIHIYTHSQPRGYQTGAEASQALNSHKGSYSLYGKWNKGKGEFSLNYDFNYRNTANEFMEEKADYHLTDGSIHTISRNDEEAFQKSRNHQLKLTYHAADSARYVFQVSLDGSLSQTPEDFNRKKIHDGTETYTACQSQTYRSGSPVLDLYYFRQLTPRQSLTFNTVGTYIHTELSNRYDEGTPYAYRVNGNTGSVVSEGIYENRLSPFTVSAGINHRFKYIHNEYSGDTESQNRIYNQRIYAFSELKGAWRKFRYTLGIGASYTHYRQGEYAYDYWLFTPKLSVTYRFTDPLQLSYHFQSNDRVSQIALLSDVMLRTNRMEWIQGSPTLKPNRDVTHTLRLSYNRARLQSYLQGFYKICHHPNMATYERTHDNRFIYSQHNQKEINALQAMAYVNYWMIPDRLSVSAYGGLFRCFNFGDDYTHCYTSYFITGNVGVYWKNFSLLAYADNGWRFLEGETKGYNGMETALRASYTLRQWKFSLTWQYPLMNQYKKFESEVLNRNLQKTTTLYSRESNLVSLGISWRFSKGRRFQPADKTIQLKDNDTGIIR